jgi:tetratricopeptide (TPR) repeat protein
MRYVPLCIILLLLSAGGCDLRSSSERAVDHYVASRLLAEQGNVEAALAELTRALEADPSLSVAHEAIGDIHRKRGSHRLAARSYEQATELNPYAFRPHYNLGVTYQALADQARAKSKLTACMEYLDQAVRTYLRAVTLDESDFDTHLNLSACYFQQGKYDLAEQYCRAAIKLQPGSAEAYSNLGVIYDSRGELYKAIRAYKDSLERDAQQPKLLLNLGSTYLRQGPVGVKRALNAFELAAELDPDDPDAWTNIGLCQFKARNFDEALAAYRKAAELDPRSAAAHRGVGTVWMSQWLLDQGKEQLRGRALESWTLSLELNPNQPKLRELVDKYAPRDQTPKL